jgi:aspartyl-tRNA(Asn)/glutamyl-tRNA(Gln) amidotransferase subunit C
MQKDSKTTERASLSVEEVRRLAHLARLRLTEDEAVHFAPQLDKILDHISDLESVLVPEGTLPLLHPLDEPMRMRPDQVREFDRDPSGTSTVVTCGPQVQDQSYRVPPVV